MLINTDKGMHVDNSRNILLLIALYLTPLKGPPSISLHNLDIHSYSWCFLFQSLSTSLFSLSLYISFLKFFLVSKVWLKAGSALRLLSFTMLKSPFFLSQVHFSIICLFFAQVFRHMWLCNMWF